MAVAVAVAVAVSGGGAVAVAVAVAGLTKRFFNHIQKDFFINVWGYRKFGGGVPEVRRGTGSSAVQNFQGIHSSPSSIMLSKVQLERLSFRFCSLGSPI